LIKSEREIAKERVRDSVCERGKGGGKERSYERH